MTHCFLNMVLSFEPALLTYLGFFLMVYIFVKCTSPHRLDKCTFFPYMLCNELVITATVHTLCCWPMREAGSCATSHAPHIPRAAAQGLQQGVAARHEEKECCCCFNFRHSCERKHLAVVQLVTVWWWWHRSPSRPLQPQAQCAAVQVTVTYKHTVPTDWAEMTQRIFLPAAISLNIQTKVWREYFLIAALTNMKNHRNIILAILFFVLKKTQDAFHKAKITGSHFSHWLAVQFYTLMLKLYRINNILQLLSWLYYT